MSEAETNKPGKTATRAWSFSCCEVTGADAFGVYCGAAGWIGRCSEGSERGRRLRATLDQIVSLDGQRRTLEEICAQARGLGVCPEKFLAAGADYRNFVQQRRQSTEAVGWHNGPRATGSEGRPGAAASVASTSGGAAHKLPPEKTDPAAIEDGGGAENPRAFGYDVEALNKEYALVKVGSQAVIFQENPGARLVEHRLRMLGIEAFKTWYRNKFTEVRGRDGKLKRVTWANRWLDDPGRRQYQGIEFFPDPYNAAGCSEYLNLWSGFAVKPAEKPDWRKYKILRDHLLRNICNGDERLYRWLFGFFAHLVQRPRERLGIALVLRGKMGTGKTKVGEIIGALFPRHYFLVDDPRYITGKFNSHMAACLLLQADEAFWAGDKAAEGRLKGLITGLTQLIEAKGVDPIRLDNFVRVIMTSNEDWVVPAGKDERRFAVFDVNDRCAKNHDYFAAMDAEMAAGGLSHLLGDLLAFDLESVDLRNAPRTAALLEQKFRSLASVDAWWLERLMSGSTSHHDSTWDRIVPCSQLFDDYVATAEKVGIRRKREQIAFGLALRKLLPSLPRERRTASIDGDRGASVRRVWCYRLPPLAEARKAFERAIEQTVEWPSENDPDGGVQENDYVNE